MIRQTQNVVCFHLHLKKVIQYSQRGTFIWTPITAIYLNVFAENDHRDRWFLPIFWVVTGVQFSPAANTARRGVRTPRISMAGHGGPWWLIAYFIQFTCILCRRWKSVDRDNPSRVTTANPRVRSSRNARVMTTRVNGCSAAVFDRAWIILTTGVRGFMKVPRTVGTIGVQNVFFINFVQPVNFKCENTASNVKTSNTYLICGIWQHINVNLK